jgi:hypothetical protein
MTRCTGRTTGTTLITALVTVAIAIFASTAHAAFGVPVYKGSLLGADGTPELAAGSHADFATTIELTTKTVEVNGKPKQAPDENVRDIEGFGPPGLVGNPNVVPRCTFAELTGNGTSALCQPEAQVGRLGAILYTAGSRFVQTLAVYNMEPPPGVPAEFGVNVAGVLVFIDAKLVNRDGTYSIALVSHNVSEGLPLGGVELTLWSVPASDTHNSIRSVGGGTKTGSEVLSKAPKLPFLSNPTTCSGAPLTFSARADSWQGGSGEAVPFSSDMAGNPLVMTDCGNVPFEASFSAQPTTTAADSPTGLDAVVTIPQTQTPDGIATSHLKDAVITLPAGIAVNPPSAAGLQSCSAAQVNLLGEAPASCPPGSKIGTVEIDTPLLADPLRGSVYVARQGENKFGSLLAIYLAVDDPKTGVVVKLPGKISTGPGGQVSASFTENPQLPFETLKVNLFGGARAALTTPPACGRYQSTAVFTPWSGTAAVTAASSFDITTGPGGSACPNGGFDPRLAAGTTSSAAGQYSPFALNLSRADGTQQLATIAAALPEGLLGRLAGIPYCPEASLAGISGAEGTAATQLVSPSCPAASQVGTVSVGAGSGPSPLYVNTGKVYLAGPYKGAPLSLAIVTPALAGPFDLGNVVVRTALMVDPSTTQITAVSDPLPTILHGIPLDLRDVRVDIDRAGFTLNPTNCRETLIGSTITGVAGAVAHPGARFRATGCDALGFEPGLKLALKGGTSRAKNPALRAVLNAPSGEANIGRVAVILPKSMFIDNRHVGNPCTRVQFNAGAGNGTECPAKSILGNATAYSPLLGEPLTGLVYFRSNGGERELPDLVASLDGQIHVNLVGFIDSVGRKGSEVSRVRTIFAGVPDAPVSRFVLQLRGGKKGLLQNSTNLCRTVNRATVKMNGQNGLVQDFKPLVTRHCGKKRNRGK